MRANVTISGVGRQLGTDDVSPDFVP